ncbi:MAG TPA: DinB family protein [Pyrinomonadaceae bacterium]|nr:DinB family protein [Pyrinomonadaceae bacterium]
MDFELEHTIALLERTPATLNSMLRDVPEALLMRNEGAETWSPYDVVGHLIHGEETDWIPRARIILAHGEARAFEPFDRVGMFEKSKGKSIAELLDEFAALRKQSLHELSEMRLTPELLEKRGKHPELGAVTMKQLLAAWVVHDLGHVRQIVRVIAKQYRDAVGPWRAYLSILEE